MNWKAWLKGFLISKLIFWVIFLFVISIIGQHYLRNPKYEKIAEDVAETVIEDELKLPQGTIKNELAVLNDDKGDGK